jgi:hypothetical protein
LGGVGTPGVGRRCGVLGWLMTGRKGGFQSCPAAGCQANLLTANMAADTIHIRKKMSHTNDLTEAERDRRICRVSMCVACERVSVHVC